MKIVPTKLEQPRLVVLDNIQYIEVEYPDYNGQSKCNNCGETIYWNKGVIHKRTKRCVPLQEPYIDRSGIIAKRHLCMQQGTKDGKWINKYEKVDSFWRDCVVHERDNRFLKDLKIDRYANATAYVRRQIQNLPVELKKKYMEDQKKWKGFTFEY